MFVLKLKAKRSQGRTIHVTEILFIELSTISKLMNTKGLNLKLGRNVSPNLRKL